MRVSGVPRRCGGHHPVGDAECGPIRLSFDPQLRVEFRGATVTSDAGLLLPRELDKRLGLDALIARHLTDPRIGHNRQFPLPDLFPSVDLQPAGRLRGYQRRRATGRGPDVSDAGLTRAAGDERRAHFDAPTGSRRTFSRKSGTTRDWLVSTRHCSSRLRPVQRTRG